MIKQKQRNYTSNILEKLLIADLDSHTNTQNLCQLEEMKAILIRYEQALNEKRST